MRAYVAVTDQRWYEFLAERPALTEANFWMPGGGPKHFGAVAPGEPFHFKTRQPQNALVGGGFLQDYGQLRLSTAWERLGEANGASSLEQMRSAISGYRKQPLERGEDPEIGCAVLRDTVFFGASDLRPTAEEFPGNVVRGKSFEIGTQLRSAVEQAFWRLLERMPGGLSSADLADLGADLDAERPMFGAPRLHIPRLGQRGFAAFVENAYAQRYAITDAKIRPALQAAHIRPVAAQGPHLVSNGLLLRADVHIMFDRGYLGITPRDHRLRVSPQLREVFGNGEEFYARSGDQIRLPVRPEQRPAREFLEWHLDEVFNRAS